ncbi:YihY/virulence factor BrkB family protein [Corynebacterium halotolerans]|uniref:YihY/virulence factor BrkB family protein n=1 Tax=Corynebacterium halotolerans TaxID=225326 RepID=UPI003CE6D225
MQPHEYIDATLEAVDTPRPEQLSKRRNLTRITWPSWRYALKRVFRGFFTDGVIDMGALLTFYTVLSLAPALLVIYSAITLVLSGYTEEITGQVEQLLQQSLPAEHRQPVLDLIDAVAGSAAAGTIGLAVGVAVALWTSSAYVRAFSRCANTIFDRAEGRGFFLQTAAMVLVNLSMLVGVILILLSLGLNEAVVSGLLGPVADPLGLGTVLDYLTGTFLPVWAWVKWPVILLALVGLVAMLYYFTPNVRPPRFRWLSLGAGVAILGIILAAAALYAYFSFLPVFSAYGAVGSVMALLVALWIFNIVLLLGVKIDAEVERARELQAGVPAEQYIQLPPRSIKRVVRMKLGQEELTAEGQELRLRHTTPPTGHAPETADDGSGAADGAAARDTGNRTP